jgi:hypothetical protein
MLENMPFHQKMDEDEVLPAINHMNISLGVNIAKLSLMSNINRQWKLDIMAREWWMTQNLCRDLQPSKSRIPTIETGI